MRMVSSRVPARTAKLATSKLAVPDVARGSRRAVSPFVATCLSRMAVGPSCRQSASRSERQEIREKTCRFAREPDMVPPSATNQVTENKDIIDWHHDDAANSPRAAILCYFRTFRKENLYFNRQPLCFQHVARPWPLTSRRAGLPSLQVPGERGLASTPWRAEMPCLSHLQTLCPAHECRAGKYNEAGC